MELSGTMIRLDRSILIDLTTRLFAHDHRFFIKLICHITNSYCFRVLSSLRRWATCLCSKPDILVFVEVCNPDWLDQLVCKEHKYWITLIGVMISISVVHLITSNFIRAFNGKSCREIVRC